MSSPENINPALTPPEVSDTFETTDALPDGAETAEFNDSPSGEQSEDVVVLRGLRLAIAKFRHQRADKLIDKLETKEEVSSSTARRALGYRAEEPISKYDDPDEYVRPLGFIEKQVARRRKNKARRTGRKAFRRQQLVEIYGDEITGELGSRRERLASGERISGSRHRSQKKAQLKRRLLAVGVTDTVGGHEHKDEQIQTIMHRESIPAKIRQRRIELARDLGDRLDGSIDHLENSRGLRDLAGEKAKIAAKKTKTASKKAAVKAREFSEDRKDDFVAFTKGDGKLDIPGIEGLDLRKPEVIIEELREKNKVLTEEKDRSHNRLSEQEGESGVSDFLGRVAKGLRRGTWVAARISTMTGVESGRISADEILQRYKNGEEITAEEAVSLLYESRAVIGTEALTKTLVKDKITDDHAFVSAIMRLVGKGLEGSRKVTRHINDMEVAED